jgi:exosortase A-associated hydrolase 1
MQFEDRAISFECEGMPLVGILSLPAQTAKRGVLIVVGGPQYRVGSHRQFILLARSLAERGIPVMRFDYRGMGDSAGEMRDFEQVNEDLRVAVDQFYREAPNLEDVVIWGLCDAASAALFYAQHDKRISGLVLLNPWVRTVGGEAKATLKHYYKDRLLQPELWRKVLSGKFAYRAAATSFVSLLGRAVNTSKSTSVQADSAPQQQSKSLPDRMCDGLQGFKGKVLFIISGMDLTAQEFTDTVNGSREWKRLMAAPRIHMQKLAEADHTFSRRVWRDQVSNWTSDWVQSW